MSAKDDADLVRWRLVLGAPADPALGARAEMSKVAGPDC